MIRNGWLNRFQSLRFQVAIIVALALAPAGALAIIQALDGVERATEKRGLLLETASLNAVDEERVALIGIKQTVRGAAAAIQVEYETRGTCSRTIKHFAEQEKWITRLIVLGRGGQSVCGAETPVSLSGVPAWADFSERSNYLLASARKSRFSGKHSLVALAPLPNPHPTAFAVAIGIDLSYLDRIGKPKADDPVFALIDNNGGVISITKEGVSKPWESGEALPWLPGDPSALTSNRDRRTEGLDLAGVERQFFTSVMEPGQIWAVTSEPVPSRLEVAFGSAGLAVLGPLAIWVIAVAVAYFAMDMLVVRHVAALRGDAVRIGRGDLERPVGKYRDAPLELRALGASIEAMAGHIADREHRLQRTLDIQKRLLLEVHHRVKNNLQTISSFMNIEKRRVTEPASVAAMRVIQDRIHSLAMVHQNLQISENLEMVTLDQLARDISGHIGASQAPVRGARNGIGEIRLDLDEIVVDTVLATPVALFLTEALSNAFEHGDREDPAVLITMRRGDGEFSVTVSNRPAEGADAGEETVKRAAAGVGGRLLGGFARQIGGGLTRDVSADRFSVTMTAPFRQAPALFTVRGDGSSRKTA